MDLIKFYRVAPKIAQMPIEQITNPFVAWINDVFDKFTLHDLLRDKTPEYIVSDHFTNVNIPGREIYGLPLFLAKNTRYIVKNLKQDATYQTQHTFNFMINKVQVNRFLCMKMVELFKLTNYDYTWSGVDVRFDLTDIIHELNCLGKNSPLSADQRSFILSNIQIPSKFIPSPGDIVTHYGIISSDNSWNWNNGLDKVFSNSVTSLITESLSFQQGTVFTEKTAYAILGRTFPLWVGGGIEQAEKFEQMGFDVFRDIIDHSYQHCPTLIERCYYAFERNLPLLSDYKYARKIREKCIDRLESNRQLLMNKQVDKFCQQQFMQWPTALQQATNDEFKKWI